MLLRLIGATFRNKKNGAIHLALPDVIVLIPRYLDVENDAPDQEHCIGYKCLIRSNHFLNIPK